CHSFFKFPFTEFRYRTPTKFRAFASWTSKHKPNARMSFSLSPERSCSVVYAYHISNWSKPGGRCMVIRLMAWLMLPGTGGDSYGPATGRVASLREYMPSIDPWVPGNRNVAELSIMGPHCVFSI